MERANSLSRRVDWAERVERDNENQVILKEEQLEIRAMKQLVEGLEKEIVKRIKEARDKDEEVIKMVEEMKRTIEDGRTGYQKLLVARNYKGSKAICGGM